MPGSSDKIPDAANESNVLPNERIPRPNEANVLVQDAGAESTMLFAPCDGP